MMTRRDFLFVHKEKWKENRRRSQKMKIIVLRIFTCSSVTLISSQPYLFFLIIMNISFNNWLVSSLSYKRRKTVQIFFLGKEKKKKSIKIKTSLIKKKINKKRSFARHKYFFLARAVVDYFFFSLCIAHKQLPAVKLYICI